MTEFRFSKIDWTIDIFVIIFIAFICGILFYNRVEMVEFDFFVFENLSVRNVAGDWNVVASYLFAISYSVLTGFFYYLCVNTWSLSKIISAPVAFLLAIIVIVFSIPIIAFFLAILAMVVGLLALFFGQVGR